LEKDVLIDLNNKRKIMLQLLTIAGQVADISVDIKRKAFVGAVAIRRDGTMVMSRNGSTPWPNGKSPSCHAEKKCLRKSGYGSTVYVARVKRDGSFALAKPCCHCMPALRAMGVEMVYWTVNNTEWEACRP
jgi:cytidine/deoxycytidylate deaminase-like protein